MSKPVLVETSARHIHVSRKHLDMLFGEGYELTSKKELSQPGQFACEERVTVVGPKKELAGVSILGPTRTNTQVELSLTDARSLGIAAPVRDSGDIVGSAPCKLVGPYGEVEIELGVIVAKRHIHMGTSDANKYGLSDKQVVEVKINSDGRSLTFGDVVIRINDKFSLAMHIDTDEGNAAGVKPGMIGEIIA